MISDGYEYLSPTVNQNKSGWKKINRKEKNGFSSTFQKLVDIPLGDSLYTLILILLFVINKQYAKELFRIYF